MEEKKSYSIIGKVEIGTDEYRDLIEGMAAAVKEASDSNSLRWKEYSRANEAENKLKECTNSLELYKKFVNSSELIKAEYIKFLGAEKSED